MKEKYLTMPFSCHLTLMFVFLFIISCQEQAWAGWSTDPSVNTPVCTANDSQNAPAIMSDGSGGVIVAWDDFRNGGSNDIYVQHINASGTPQWTVDGVAVCTASGYQSTPAIISDGSGGAIIAWKDSRGSDYDIYAQRINKDGVLGVTLDDFPWEIFYPAFINKN